jgi:hypothetical protein
VYVLLFGSTRYTPPGNSCENSWTRFPVQHLNKEQFPRCLNCTPGVQQDVPGQSSRYVDQIQAGDFGAVQMPCGGTISTCPMELTGNIGNRTTNSYKVKQIRPCNERHKDRTNKQPSRGTIDRIDERSITVHGPGKRRSERAEDGTNKTIEETDMEGTNNQMSERQNMQLIE